MAELKLCYKRQGRNKEKVKYGPSESFISSQNYLFLIAEAIPYAFECHLFRGKEQYSLYEYQGLCCKPSINSGLDRILINCSINQEFLL
uniref:Uncharacterized protein n=1 Tax=Anser brachyrhynchus TaxID=132585 RepID=A0A8B9C7M8_9AVES